MPPRTLRAHQRADLHVIDLTTGTTRLVHSSSELLFEAPNWTPDGRWLVVNGDGLLFRIPVEGGEPEEIPLGDIPPINNDHVISPDGSTVYVSADDGHLYAVPFATGVPRRVSNDAAPGFRHFLHGISPDGATLAYIGLFEAPDGSVTTDVYTVPAAGGADVRLTDDPFAYDGSEYSPDGQWIYVNSERASTEPGHAQLFRMSVDGATFEQLTHDERVNWFPHVSPDGERIAYVSFASGTLGHPEDRDVIVRLIEADGSIRDVAHLFGGQGTMNVPSWAPDSTAFAFVSYPIES